MAGNTYTFRLPDGRLLPIAGAPSEEAALEYLDSLWPTLRLETPIEGFGESFGQQFRGQIGSVPGAAQAAAAAVGAPETAAFLGRGRTAIAPGDQNPATRAPEPGDFLRDPIDALKAYAGQAAGAVLGGAATLGATALLGAGIGGAVGGAPGAAAGALTGARAGFYGGSVLGGVDELYQGLVAEGVDPQRAGVLASTLGAGIGAVEAAALGPALNRVLGGKVPSGVIDRVTSRILGGRAGGVRQTAVAGAGGEAAGETARQGVIAAETGNLDLYDRASRVGEAAIVGGIAGGGIGGGLRLAGRAGPSPTETPPTPEQEAADLRTLRAGSLPGETPPDGIAPSATTPETPTAETETATRPPPLPVPERPAPLTDVEEARAFLAANPTVAPAVMPTRPDAILGAANNARIDTWNQEVANTRARALTEFFPAAPETNQVSPVEAVNNIAAAANRGELNLRSFTPNAVARAALSLRDIDPGRISTPELKAVTDQLNSLVASGALRQNTVETTTTNKRGKKVVKRESVYSLNYGAATPAQPTVAAAAPTPATQAAASSESPALPEWEARANAAGDAVLTQQERDILVTDQNRDAGAPAPEVAPILEKRNAAIRAWQAVNPPPAPAAASPAPMTTPIPSVQPSARTTVEVDGVQRETTPETVQQTIDEIRTGQQAAPSPATTPPPPPPPANPLLQPSIPAAEKQALERQVNEPLISGIKNFFASPVLTIAKMSPAFAPVRTAFMRFSAIESYFKTRAAAGHKPLHELNDASKQKVIVGLDNAMRTGKEVNEADYTAQEMAAIRSFRDLMKFIYNAAIDGVARKFFDPALTADPNQRARLEAFQNKYAGQFLADIPDAALDAVSPEGAALVRKYKAMRNPLYFPQRTEGTHFVAAYEKGKEGPVALYGYTPLNAFQKRRGFENPEAAAIRKLREEFPNTNTHRVMTAGVKFENDKFAKKLKLDGDFINKYLDRLREVSGSEGKRIIAQMGAEIDKAKMDSLFKPYKGILRAVTPENAVEYANSYLPAYYLTAGRLNTRLITQDDFKQAFKPLRAENREIFQSILDYGTSPTEAYGTARTFVFMSYLGFALDTAMVSALQIPTAVAPRLGRDGGIAKGTQYFTKALNEALFDKAVFSVLKSDQAYAQELSKKLNRPDEVAVMKRAIARGVLRPSTAFQMQGSVSASDVRAAGITDKSAGKFADGINKVVDLAGRPLAAVEEYGRNATFLAAYRMARDNPSVIEQANRYDNTQYKNAEDYAQGVVFDTWYAGSKMDDPGFIRNLPILNLATQFMRPVFKFTETILRDAYKTLEGMAKFDLTMARMGAISLFGSLGTLVALGGVWALPFADVSRELMERILRLLGNPVDLRLQLDRAMGGKWLGEAANFGAPYASNWANLSKRVAVDPIPTDTLFNFNTLALIGPAGDLLTRIPRTFEHWKRGEYWEAAASFPLTPRVASNAIKGTQLAVAQEQFTQAGTRFITPQVLERVDSRLNVPASARQALGFPAPELANERELWRRAEFIDKATDEASKAMTLELSRFYLRAYEAQRQGDMAENARQVEALQRRLREITAEQATRPAELRVTPNLNAAMDRARKDLFGRSDPNVIIQDTRRQARSALPQVIEDMRWRDRQ